MRGSERTADASAHLSPKRPVVRSEPVCRPNVSPARLLLLALATVHLVWFYLQQVPSGIQLAAYEQGRERMPFQGRFLLEPLLRWAHGSPVIGYASCGLHALPWIFPRPVSPEGILQAVLDVLAVASAGLVATALYRRGSPNGRCAALVYPLVLLMSLLMYAAVTSHAYRFVYDLPQMALFSLGLLLIYDRRFALFTACFLLATLNKETSIVLLANLLLAERARGYRTMHTLRLALPLFVAWAAWQLWLRHHYALNASARDPRLLMNIVVLFTPAFWPQLVSVFAFLLPLIVAHRRQIRNPVLASWLAALPIWGVLMLFFGLLLETRIFGELIPYMAACAVLIGEELLLHQADPGQAERERRPESEPAPACERVALLQEQQLQRTFSRSSTTTTSRTEPIPPVP